MKKIFYVILVLLFVFSSSMPAFALTGSDFWIGGTSVNLGDSSDNWSGASANNPPITGDSWVFDVADGPSLTTLNNNLSSFSVNGITFNADASAFTINGNSITLTGNIANNSNNAETLGMGIAGTIINSGTGSGSTIITGGVASSVAAITEDSASSPLTISGGLSVNGSGTTLTNSNSSGSSVLTISGGASGAGNLILNNNSSIADGITLSSSSINNTGTITNSGTGSGSVIISADIGSNVTDLTQDSATSPLVLSGDNAYTGATTVNNGILSIQNGNALSGSSGTTVASGAALRMQNNITTSAEPLTLNGTGVSGGGALENVSGNNTYAGLITLGSDTQINSDSGSLTLSNTGIITGAGDALTIGGAGDTILNSIIGTGTGTLTKDGTGTLTLTGANTYSGDTTLDAGTLNLGGINAIGSGTVIFDGGTLQYSASNNTDYSSQFSTGAGQAFNIDTNGQDVTFAGALDSTGGELTKIGSGTLTLTGANTYSGITTISGGTLQIGNGGITGSLGTGNVTDNANLAFDLTNNPTVSNIISGTGTLTQNGTDTVTLSGPNTYTGATTVNAGTLEAGAVNQAFGLGSAVAVAVAGTLDLGGLNETIGSLAGAGTVTNSGGASAILTTGAGNASTAFSGNIQDGANPVGITKEGSGIFTLSGTNTYSGETSLDAGTLNLGSADALGSGTVIFDGGTLQYSGSNNTDYSSQFSTGAGQAFNIDTNGQDVTFAAALESTGGELTKIGSGTLTLTGANTYTGGTTINAGTLTVGAGGTLGATTGALSVNNTNTGAGTDVLLNLATTVPTTTGSLSGTMASPSSGVNTATINNEGQLFTVNQTANSAYAGVIEGAGGFALGNFSSNTLTLSGDNTYSGGTTINAGLLQVANTNALGTGAVVNNATLVLGTTNLSLGGAYTQNTSSALYLTADSASMYGKITAAVAASVAAGSTINVTVGGFIQNGSALEIINTGGLGIGSDPSTITSSSSLVSFSSSILGGNLVLTAANAGFTPLADNSNAKAVATVLDSITSPSSDMTTILNALAISSNAKISSSLNTMGPIVDGGVIQNSSATLNNLVSATLDRIQTSLDQPASGNSAFTGVSSGDETTLNGVWAKPYGSYLTQGTLQGIQGYDAWNAGTVIGYDHMISDSFTLGVSGGYAYGQVNSDANNANTDINSAQGTIYAGYQDPNLNYFIDAMGTFAWNWYDGQRDISVGAINRTADSNYDGQQYGAYLGGGYKINVGDNLKFTPLASIQWSHLSLPSYTETNAGAVDLNVDSQSYDILESGVGASVSYPVKYDWGNFTPEFHAKWLYDFINDNTVVTSSFTGGGGSFTSNGANPAKDGVNIGGKLSFDLNNDLSLIAGLDTELKDGFFGVYGSGTVHYKF